MKKIYTLLFTTLFVFASGFVLQAQTLFFKDINQSAIQAGNAKRVIIPEKYRTVTANITQLKSFLWALPGEKRVANKNQAPVLEIPMPNGSIAKFNVWESSVMEPGLETKFPEMKTFAGRGITDPYATIRLDYNPYFGFHAQILSASTGAYYIDPFAKGNTENYISYYKKDLNKNAPFTCETENNNPSINNAVAAGPCRGTELFTYRLALACTGEYATAVCSPNAPTVPVTAAAMLTTVNRVTGVYETEISLRMVLVANNDALIYLNGSTDPYTNNNGGTMLGQNQSNVDAVIGDANYDIGHVVSTGGGGVAFLRVPCVSGSKAGGVTGLGNPVGDPFDIDYVAHEMGHQWGGNHTFNSSTSSCGGGNRNGSTAYEVGSGTTIQAYAGICGADNTQPNSDPFFHTLSFDEISNYISTGNGNTCKVATSNGNTLPVIASMSNNGANIPIGTPFILSATATDANNDPLTYCWEEWDLGPSTTWNGGNVNTTSPLFKSRIPKTNGSRTFPDIAVILAGYPANPPVAMGGLKGETLPTQARALKFRLTVRDNAGGVVTGGDGCQSGFAGTFQINTIATSGPFAVSAPNGGETYGGGTTQTITWNTVGTENTPISVANVKVSYSTDGGLTYPTIITASTPNDGTESLTIPGGVTNTARIKIEAIGNIFFDISNADFSVTAPPVGFEFASGAATTSVACAGATSASITLGTISNGGFVTPITLSASGNPAGTTVGFSVNPVVPGNSTLVTLSNTNTLAFGTYNITVSGTSGAITQNKILAFTVTPGTGPSITAQPAAQVSCAGSAASFSITATGATGYQWQVSTDGGVNFNNIVTATSASYTISSVTASQNNYLYRCLANGQCNTTTSAAALLTVQASPAITTQPLASAICATQNTLFSVAATGTGLTYQWMVSTNTCATVTNLVNGAPYSGVNTPTLTITGATAALNNNSYRCMVSGACPAGVTTSCTPLIVNTPVNIIAQPAAATSCAAGIATFSVTATGTTPAYQWQESTNGGGAWNNITNGGIYTGATTAAITLTGVTAGMNNNQYRCIVTGTAPCTPVNSNAGILSVNTAPAITAQPVTSTTLCAGSNTSYTVTANGTALTYQWQLSTTGAAGPWNDVINGGIYTGATTATLTLTGITPAITFSQYRCVVNGTCTPAVTSANTALTVISPVSITTQPIGNTAICSTGNTNFTVAGSSSVAILYQWQVSTDGGTNWANISNTTPYTGTTTGTLTITNTPTSLSGNRYRALLSNATCTVPATSGISALTVNVLPTAAIAAPKTALQAGQSTVITATTTPSTGLSIIWQRDGITVPNATSNNYTVTVNNLGTYKAIVTDLATGTCINQSNSLEITALPSEKLFVFPSPNDGLFTVTYYNATTTATSQGITIYDRFGRRVYDKTFPVTQAYQLHQINLRGNGAGIYYVFMRDANGKKIKTGEVMIK
jgi:Metallo-peptidase family M12/Secretion system C-terminal sorting domain